MDFFSYQEKARRKSLMLVAGFILSVACIILLVDALALFARSSMLVQEIDRSYGRNIFWFLRLDIINITLCVIILSASIYKYYRLKSGGVSIVELMNATPLNRDDLRPPVKQLFNVVDEISIASGILAPMVFLLENEAGINAFVAGYNPNDTVLVVSQGALDNLSRDEMQGVIAHEYSHIFNSDMALNLRLIIVLGGLLGLSQMGNALLRARRSGGGPVILGGILYVCGLIGVLFGNVLRAAISRQRETLADASAVQYTRDPSGIARALLKIKAQGQAALMENARAEEVNHMCFSVARDISLGLFASHPKLDLRIAMLDPTGEIRAQFLEPDLGQTTKVQSTPVQHAPLAQTAGTFLATGAAIASSIGNPSQHSLSHAAAFLQSIPKELMAMLNNAATTQALMYAIALSCVKNSTPTTAALSLPSEVQQLLPQCINNPGLNNPHYTAALVSLAIPKLKALDDETKNDFLRNISSILESNLTIHGALLLTILSQHLQENTFQKTPVKYNDFRDIETEVKCILWFLAQQSNQEEGAPTQAFNAAMQQLFATKISNIHDLNFQTQDLATSLSKLRFIAPNLKQQFINVCVTCIEADGHITLLEAELLKAVCTCLDCPVPLLASITTKKA